MNDTYSIKDVAQIFGLEPSRLRYWAQTGFVNPSVRRGGRMFYTFQDLVAVRTAKGLLDAGLTLQKVRKNLESLRALLPQVVHPASKMRICSDGETVVAVDGAVAFEPTTGQVVMSFTVDGLSSEVAEILALPGSQPVHARSDAAISDGQTDSSDSNDTTDTPDAAGGTAAAPEDGLTPAGEPQTAYQCFLQACDAEDRGALGLAEQLYRHAILAQPSLAAACTNLGNLLYRRGALADARAAYEHALEYEPGQAEARYNLGNLLEDLGETELSIAELRRVCWTHPDFADAHYNLGLMLARVGGINQARKHLERYLELESESEWATRARTFLDALRDARPAASNQSY
ncbi:MAG TPA: MerR family transcriptional regulator [Haliangium sp.]|nr:MerR family transcriptional regulator [Haliangium sp.]